MGGRGASTGKRIKNGDYKYTKNGANLSIKVVGTKNGKILLQAAGFGPSGGFLDGTLTEVNPNAEIIKGMKKV